MIVPTGAPNFREGLRWCAEITHHLGPAAESPGGSPPAWGTRAALPPILESDEAAIEAVLEAVEKGGLTGAKVQLALGRRRQRVGPRKTAATACPSGQGAGYRGHDRVLGKPGAEVPPSSPSRTPWGRRTGRGWAEMTRRLGDKVQLVGDDLFVTNSERLRQGMDEGAGQRHPHQAQPDWHPSPKPWTASSWPSGAATRPSSSHRSGGDGGHLHRGLGGGGQRRADKDRGRPAAPSGWPSTTACCASRSAVDRTGESWLWMGAGKFLFIPRKGRFPCSPMNACRPVVAAIRQKTDFAPRTALVLGSGLGGFGERLALEAAGGLQGHPRLPRLHGARPPGQVPLWLCGGGACGGHAGPRPLLRGLRHGGRGAAHPGDGPAGGQALGAHQRRRGHRPWAGGRGLDAPHRPHRRLCALAPHRAQRGGAGAPLPRHDGGLLPPAAGKGPGGGPAPGHPPEGRGCTCRPPAPSTRHRRKSACSRPWAPTPWA